MSCAGQSSARVLAKRFEDLYEASADPWHYRSSEYELEKYASTLAALGSRSFSRALEVGCSIGVFTELLAQRCESVVGIDFSARALALARWRLRSRANVTILRAAFPEHTPAGTWELIVCSEVLYYLDRPALGEALRWLEEQLHSGAIVLAVSWRGKGDDEPLQGDTVHDLMYDRLGRWHAFDGRQSGYRLDRFDGYAR
jgi:SAM-dependent methyltransferase